MHPRRSKGCKRNGEKPLSQRVEEELNSDNFGFGEVFGFAQSDSVFVGEHIMFPLKHIKIRGRLIGAPTRLIESGCVGHDVPIITVNLWRVDKRHALQERLKQALKFSVADP